MQEKKLKRSCKNKMIAGVCGGWAEYLNVDPSIVRIVFVLLSLCSAAFPGLLIYLVSALLMPMDNGE